ncbi:hypothetical protein PVAND_002923 [Polypedilum vanderplanki]|uniref:Queuosine 5'-phosphate N-glycosylase/hydrolase n=1 Tax=Polypedilum vanderplanki TaxID=319348 RepID=A0A9J6BSH3_POLVA|nr:hypothetical protein PVAND_002923 [Polypedilum vanderplanki]
MLSPKESGEFVVKNAKYIQVKEEGIKNLSNLVYSAIKDGSLSVNNFSQVSFHPNQNDVKAVDWLFVVDTLNYCFWTPEKNENKWKVENQTGYFALCAAINRAQREGIDITNASYYSKITLDDVKKIFRGDDDETEVPLIETRVTSLHEIGKILLEKYDGTFLNVVKKANNSASELLKLIVQEFPCFRDEAVYQGTKISLYKRAQILVGDIYACFKGQGLGKFDDINDAITVFADYRVPMVLVHFGSLEYNEELMQDLKNNKILIYGEEKEIEIRAATIYIAEKVKELVLQMIKDENNTEISTKDINSILIDHFLWDYRRSNAETLSYIPFHKTYSIYY